MENKQAVSPVIGVILMVAITVILAAIIAAFAFGMTGSIQKPKEFAVSASRAGSNIVVTVHGGVDQASVAANSLNITADAIGGNLAQIAVLNKPTSVGTSVQLHLPDVTLKYHVVVTVTFDDGSQQVVLDSEV